MVRIECVVQNEHNQAGSEEFPMHFKLANRPGYPTSGLHPFWDDAHPVCIDGNLYEADTPESTLTGTDGVPVKLVGNQEVSLSYYATIGQDVGAGVVVSHQLIEDSFGGTHLVKTELLEARPLCPADPDADPSDPEKWGVAGSDYHYKRTPQPNNNGWNNGPVSVQFFAGDYDSLFVEGPDGESLAELANREKWTQSADTNGLAISMKASSKATGLVSVRSSEAIKIDTSAPRIEADAALSAYKIGRAHV